MTYDNEVVPAIAYLRIDLSGGALAWDRRRIQQRASQLGYTLRETLHASPQQQLAPLALLLDEIHHHEAEAVFVPTVAHLDGHLDRVMRLADVIDLEGGCYARWHPIAEAMGDIALLEHRNPSEAP